jgi:stage II sporulation protein AA (anti-sigma F factor antagonist)
MNVTDEFRQKVDSALENSGVKHLLLSIKGVTFIDSSGVGVILGRYKKVTSLGGRLAVAGARAQVSRILELSGLMTIINLFGSETEALENL